MPDTYLQSQLAYWIPVGGDQNYQGAIWHYQQIVANPLLGYA